MQTAKTKRPSRTEEYLRTLRTDERWKFWIVSLGVAVVCFVAYFCLAAGWAKFSRAEVFFAECVREMRLAGTLVTPLYHGTPFFDKPILSYWLIDISYQAFGISHLAARVPSILAAVATVLITAVSGRFLFGSRVGSLSCAVLGSSFMFLSFAALCMSDMMLVFLDTVTMALLYLSTVRPERRSLCLWAAALSMGLAFLTKGPVGVVLPGLSFTTYLSVTGQWRTIRFFAHVVPCLAILTLASSPWFIAAFRENGPGALAYFFLRENVQRFAGDTYDTHKPVYFTILSLFSGLLPWSIFLPAALGKSIAVFRAAGGSLGFRAEPESRKHLFLWLWIATVTVFFSLSRGKIDYYVLPVYPAASILIACWLTGAIEQGSRVSRGVAWIVSALVSIAGLGGLFAFSTMMYGARPEAQLLTPLVLCACGILMLLLSFKGEMRKVYKMLFVTVCLSVTAFSLQVFPWIKSQQAVLAYVDRIADTPEATRIGVFASLTNWIDEITFQTGKEPLPIKDLSMAARFLSAPASALLLIPEADYLALDENLRSRCAVLDSRPFIGRSLNPGYFISHFKKLDRSKLLLVRNHPMHSECWGL